MSKTAVPAGAGANHGAMPDGKHPGASAAWRVDMASGILWAGGDELLYRDLCGDFVDAYAPGVTLLDPSRGPAEPADIKRLAHSLKTSAALLGAEVLRARAVEVDEALRGGGPVNAHSLALLRTELAQVLAEVAERQGIELPGAPSEGGKPSGG